MGIWYCTREDVKSALDIQTTALVDSQIDRAIESASRSVEGLLHRKFYPHIATKYFDWPNYQRARSWRLWLDENELISVTTLTSGGIAISSNDYFLEPINSGPPYNRIETDLGSNASFNTGDTSQRSIAITGLFGYNDDSNPAGSLAEALDAIETDVNVSNGALIGIGSIVKVESERMFVTGRSWITSSQTTQSSLGGEDDDVTVAVTTGSSYNVGEQILIGSETMYITAISGNNLTVKRAWDGSVLATHNSGVTIYVSRTFTVTRGALGTTAATHSDATAITTYAVPGLVKELAIAEALNVMLQEGSGYARTTGEGENSQEFLGRGLRGIRDQAYTVYGRKARTGAV